MVRNKSLRRGTHRVKFPDTAKEKESLREFRNDQEMKRERKISTENIWPLVEKIIKAIFNKSKTEWPRTNEQLLNMFNDGVMNEGGSAEEARDFEATYHDDIKKLAAREWKKAQEKLEDEARVERYRREEEEEEEERQKLCKNFGICTAAAFAGAGAAAVVGAPVIATTAAAAAAAFGLRKYQGKIGGRKKTRKRQRKSKRKSRRKKRKKRKTRRLRRKSR